MAKLHFLVLNVELNVLPQERAVSMRVKLRSLFCSVQVVFLHVLLRLWCRLRLQPGVKNLSPVPRHISAFIEIVVQVSCDAGRHHLGRTWPLRDKESTYSNTHTCLPVSCDMPPSVLNPTAEAAFGYVVKYTCDEVIKDRVR